MDNQNNNGVPEPITSVPTPVEEAPATSASQENAFGPSTNTNTNQNQGVHVQTQMGTKKERETFNVDELLKSFIGPNYDKFLMRPFNFAAFFFTWMYYFYRKMTLYGIIILILQGVISYFLIDTPYAVLVINIFCGFLTNKLYANFALRKINKELISSAGKSTDFVKGVCSVKGGRSIKRIFTTIIWLFLALIPVGMILALLNLSTDFKNLINNFEFNVDDIKFSDIKLPNVELPNMEFDTKYSGYLVVDKSVPVKDKFNVNIPKVFKATANNDQYNMEYSYRSTDKPLGACTFTFRAVTEFKNAKNLITSMQEYYKDKNATPVREDYINKFYWYGFNYEEENANIYYYATTNVDKIYLYTFVDEKKTTKACHDYAANLLNTISNK